MAVSPHHESLHQVFQQDTELLVTAMQRLLGLCVGPVLAITPLDTAVTELLPMERRVDSLFRLDTEDRRYVVALESQGKPDPDKRRSWPYYLAYLGERYDADAVLIVLTDDSATERWASQPISSGFSSRPSLITQPLVEAGLTGSVAVEIWRQLMSKMDVFYRSEAAQKVRAEGWEGGREEGRATERAQTVVMILERRGLDVPDTLRQHILACQDYEQLGVWLDRALQITDAQDLIDDVDV